MKIYMVGDNGPEHNRVRSLHRTYECAFREWNKLRLELLEKAKSFLNGDRYEKMWKEIVDNLSCEDPEKIDNYPHDTPYIREYELQK